MAARNRIISLNKFSLYIYIYKNYLLIMRFSMYLKQESSSGFHPLSTYFEQICLNLVCIQVLIYWKKKKKNLKMSPKILTRMLKTSSPGLYWDFEQSYFLDFFFLFQEILTSVIILLHWQIILLVKRTFCSLLVIFCSVYSLCLWAHLATAEMSSFSQTQIWSPYV